MYIILFAIFIDLVGFGLIIPILPFLTLSMVGEGMTLSLPLIGPFEVSAAVIGTGLMATYSLTTFLAGPIWGRLSDRFGRRPTLAVTFLGGTLSYVMLAHADSILMLFIARAVSGAMAGNVGIAMASMADLTTAADRGRAMGLIGGAFGLGFAVGPGLGGLLSQISGDTSIYYPGLVAAALSFSAMVLTLWRVPETNPHRDDSHTPSGARPRWQAIFAGPAVITMFVMFVVTAIGQSLSYSIVPFWAAAVLSWNALEVGFLMMGVGAVVFTLQTFVVGPLFREVGEVRAAAMGALAQLTGCALLISLPPSLLMAIVGVPLMMTGLTLCFPALNALVSQRSDQRLQGTALGFASGLSSLGRVVGPLYAGYLFTPATPTLPFVAVALVGLSVLGWTFLDPILRRYDQGPPESGHGESD